MSHRIAQVESTLKRAISEVLQRRISDPRIEGLISITRIQISPDLHNAYVYVSILPEQKQRKVIAGLRHATKHIQSLVRKAVAMRAVPQLEFRLDEGLKREADVLGAIRRAAERTGISVNAEDAAEEAADQQQTVDGAEDESSDANA